MKIKQLRMGYQAYLVPRRVIDTLAVGFPPRFSKFNPHHVTITYGVTQQEPLPQGMAQIEVVGYASDRKGLETFICKVNGTETRPDGLTYHITWSYDPKQGYEPKHATDIITQYGWVPVRTGVEWKAEAEFF